MVGRIAPSEYFPDRAPTWTEVGLCVLVVVGFFPQIHARSAISWPAVLVGYGALLAGVLYVVAYVAWAGEVSGWGWETGRE